MNTRFKVFASYNILQYLCDFIHVLIFVTVSKCRKGPKLMNIVMKMNSHKCDLNFMIVQTNLALDATKSIGIMNRVHYTNNHLMILSTNFTTCCEQFHDFVPIFTILQNWFHELYSFISQLLFIFSNLFFIVIIYLIHSASTWG